MWSLVLAGAVFVGIHLFIPGTPLRERIVAAIGERPYLGLFSLRSMRQPRLPGAAIRSDRYARPSRGPTDTPAGG